MSAAKKFKQALGDELLEFLGPEWRFFRSRCEFVRPAGEGDDVLILSGRNQFSPSIDVSLYFGRRFHAAAAIQKSLGREVSLYHVFD